MYKIFQKLKRNSLSGTLEEAAISYNDQHIQPLSSLMLELLYKTLGRVLQVFSSAEFTSS